MKYFTVPPPELLSDLGTLGRTSKSFQRTLAWLEESLRAIRKVNETTEDERRVRQGQGAGQCLDEFLNTVSTASDVQRPFTP
jgi:hypothetical protein